MSDWGTIPFEGPRWQDTKVPPTRGDPAIAARVRWRWETAKKAPHDGRADTGRRWKIPKESTPGPDFGLKELEAIAWAEAKRSPGLTPNGGRRWTREDVAFAVSVLDAETRNRGFRRAWDSGMRKAQARSWLSKALHNRLLDHVKRLHRIKLLDDLALDVFPAADGDRTRLDREDRTILVERVFAKLEVEVRSAAVRHLRGDTEALAVDGRSPEAAWRNQRRYMRRFREALLGVATRAELGREEVEDLLRALAAKLTGGGDP